MKAINYISSNGGIVLSLFYLVIHFIDNVNFAMGFIEYEPTGVLMLILSVFALLSSLFAFAEKKSFFTKCIAFTSLFFAVQYILYSLEIISPYHETGEMKSALFILSITAIITAVSNISNTIRRIAI